MHRSFKMDTSKVVHCPVCPGWRGATHPAHQRTDQQAARWWYTNGLMHLVRLNVRLWRHHKDTFSIISVVRAAVPTPPGYNTFTMMHECIFLLMVFLKAWLSRCNILGGFWKFSSVQKWQLVCAPGPVIGPMLIQCSAVAVGIVILC